jgi:hypothetical protein
VGNRGVKLWSIVNEDVLTIAVDLREGTFLQFWTWLCVPKIDAIILGAVEEFESMLQAVEMELMQARI